MADVSNVESVDDPAARRVRLLEFRKTIHQRVVDLVGIGRTLGRDELGRQVEASLDRVLRDLEVPPELKLTKDEVRKDSLEGILGFGPLEDLLRDPTVNDIMVNRHDQIYVERTGQLELTDRAFLDSGNLRNVIDRMLRVIGKSVNELNPFVDGRLEDGSRVHVIIPPLALDGPMLTIRKFPSVPITVADLVERFGTLTAAAAEFLRIAVRHRRNMVISGGSGAGKTSLLNVLSSFIPHRERIVTIEDSAELKLGQPNVGRLESRAANYEGKGAVPIRELVRNALRMRPDRIIVGECRGGEAIDMLQAMNTGHDGSLTTVHANSPQDVLSRLETMVTMAGFEIPLLAIRRQLASAVNLIVQVARLGDGTRRLMKISEVTGMDGHDIVMQDIFEFDRGNVTSDGRVSGVLRALGNMPTFIDDLSSTESETLRSILVAVPKER